MGSPEHRESIRILLGPEFSVRFTVMGHAFRDVRITNASVGGCFALVGARDIALFPQGILLDQFSFEHPDMPEGCFAAEVRYVLGGSSAESSDAHIGLGLQFAAMNEGTRQALKTFLDARAPK